MDELDIQSVDLRHEHRQGIQLGFALSPVVFAAPVLNELLHAREPHALGFVSDRFLTWPARSGQALA
ncbi:hypothetical protein CBA19C8_29660 [Paraburkholderia terrae]|nr:hypothetical protein CBA19C8_29660 [Paraburkholderia terrae]